MCLLKLTTEEISSCGSRLAPPTGSTTAAAPAAVVPREDLEVAGPRAENHGPPRAVVEPQLALRLLAGGGDRARGGRAECSDVGSGGRGGERQNRKRRQRDQQHPCCLHVR